MGKDFFSRKSKSDFFETPYSKTRQFLKIEVFLYDKSYLECACGNNAIVKVLKEYINSDNIEYYDKNLVEKRFNFLNEWRKYDYIITNPPYSQWDEFVAKAKQIARIKFAFLGRLEYLTGLKSAASVQEVIGKFEVYEVKGKRLSNGHKIIVHLECTYDKDLDLKITNLKFNDVVLTMQKIQEDMFEGIDIEEPEE